MSESYGSLPTPIEALRNLLTQVENCDGTAQIDTDEAEAVLNAQQQGPTRLRTERRDGPFGPFDLLVAPVLREVDGAVVDTGERESLMIDSTEPIPLSERKPGQVIEITTASAGGGERTTPIDSRGCTQLAGAPTGFPPTPSTCRRGWKDERVAIIIRAR